MKKVGIIYWPKGGNVESVAFRIHKQFDSAGADIFDVESFDAGKINDYENLIVGGSTTGSETWEEVTPTNKWGVLLNNMDKSGIEGKKVAIFGLGDQVLWPRNFVDSMIVIKKEFDQRGAEIVGYWPTEGYDFTESASIENGQFVGLALDEDQQAEKTEERIEKWTAQLKKAFGI